MTTTTRWQPPREVHADMDAVARNLWLLAEIARLERRVDLLEAYVRVLKLGREILLERELKVERERWESKHKGEAT